MTVKERRRASRAQRGPVEAVCISCGWVAASTTWRPAKRELSEHTAKRHPVPA